MDIPRLRRLAAEVDEEHREAMRGLAERLGDTVDRGAAPPEQRRAFLRRVATGGLAVAAGSTVFVPVLAGVAAAQETTTGSGDSEGGGPGATTTTPRQPTTEDRAILAFAQSVELAAHQAYDAALATGMPSELVPVLATFGYHHLQHAQAAAGYAGKLGTGRANPGLLETVGEALGQATTSDQVLEELLKLEQAAAATYQAALGALVGLDAAMAVASIEPIEARHAVVLAEALGLPLEDYIPAFQTTTGAFSPEQYPVIEGELP